MTTKTLRRATKLLGLLWLSACGERANQSASRAQDATQHPADAGCDAVSSANPSASNTALTASTSTLSASGATSTSVIDAGDTPPNSPDGAASVEIPLGSTSAAASSGAPGPSALPSTRVEPRPQPSISIEPPCAGACGNGEVDSCPLCPPSDGTCYPEADSAVADAGVVVPCTPEPRDCYPRAEECDGQLEAGVTCSSLGFADGDLSCSGACVFDDRACHSCRSEPEIAACLDTFGIGYQPRFVALSANAEELALAWDEGCSVTAAWLSADLHVLRSVTLDAECNAGTTGKVVIAPLGTGWVLAAGITQFVLDANGNVQDRRITSGSALFAAPRIGTTPLIVRVQDYSTVTAALLDLDGSELWSTEVAEGTIEPEYGSAAATEEGFLVGLRTSAAVDVFHLEAETGTVTDDTAVGSYTSEYPQLAAAGDQVRMLWSEFGDSPQIYWIALDAIGHPISYALPVGYYNRSPIVVDGQDTIALFGGYTGITGVGTDHQLRRMAANSATLAGDFSVQLDANGVRWPQLAAFDGQFYAAWVGQGLNGRVGIARVEL